MGPSGKPPHTTTYLNITRKVKYRPREWTPTLQCTNQIHVNPWVVLRILRVQACFVHACRDISEGPHRNKGAKQGEQYPSSSFQAESRDQQISGVRVCVLWVGTLPSPHKWCWSEYLEQTVKTNVAPVKPGALTLRATAPHLYPGPSFLPPLRLNRRFLRYLVLIFLRGKSGLAVLCFCTSNGLPGDDGEGEPAGEGSGLSLNNNCVGDGRAASY